MNLGSHRQSAADEQLGGGVFRRQATRCSSAISKRLGQPQVDEVCIVTFRRDDDVRWLYVAMQQAGAVYARQLFGRQRQPTEAAARVGARLDQLLQAMALDEVSQHVQARVVGEL